MPHNQQNDLVFTDFYISCEYSAANQVIARMLQQKILAVASSSKLPTVETLRSFFPLHGAPVYLLAILTLTNCKIKESGFPPTAMLRCYVKG